MDNSSTIQIIYNDDLPEETTKFIIRGLGIQAQHKKKLEPYKTLSFSIKDSHGNVLGAIKGVTYYGCLYIEFLYLEAPYRRKGYGTMLVKKIEEMAKERGCRFSTVNTMDWEGKGFYEKLGYKIEYERHGYDNDSILYMFIKPL